uniref:Uncharacterized protein n=1 Tax=Tarenaya spinosa TaxID=228870 RepID=Q1KUP5_9ROSI|nr:hypothetical protein [Tarenaya spinosa]
MELSHKLPNLISSRLVPKREILSDAGAEGNHVSFIINRWDGSFYI